MWCIVLIKDGEPDVHGPYSTKENAENVKLRWNIDGIIIEIKNHYQALEEYDGSDHEY